MNDLDLLIAVTDADGNTSILDSQASNPRNRPQAIQFSTQLQSGFTTASWGLRHPIDRDRTDINLLDPVKIIGTNGDIAYEGYVAAMPRSTDDIGHSLDITTAGWISHMTDEAFTMPFIDRDLSQWGEMSVSQRIALTAAGYNPDGGNLSTAPDSAGKPGLLSSRPGVLNKPINRFVYDAGPNNLVAKMYVGTQTLVVLGSGDANLEVYALFWSDDNGANQLSSGDVKASTFLAPDISSTPRRYAVMDWRYNSTAGGSAGVDYGVRWQDVRIIGDHGVPLIAEEGGTFPAGIAASDVLEWLIANCCPLLNTNGVQQTTYPIGHLAFKGRTKPYDAALKVNAFHQWHMAVWEDRTVHYGPIDLTDWDWEIRHDEVGSQIGLQGDSVEGLRNGIVVQYTDVTTGHPGELLPADHEELRDDDLSNPANLHGRRMYGEPLVIPYPVTAANALELGRRQLLQDSAPKAPGSFTIRDRVRDRSGKWQPAWKVRAGDRIRLTSSVSLSDRPRLIHETSYAHDARAVTIAVDSTMRTMDAYIERQQTALQAAGFG